MFLRFVLVSLLALLLGAANTASAADVPAPACSLGSSCQISGVASNQESAQGMISQLKTDDGRCLNVSLPDEVSDGLEQDGQDRMTMRGDVLDYPKAAGTDAVEVDGRSVGKGACGDDFVFVETASDVCTGEDDKCRENGFPEYKPHANKPHTVKPMVQELPAKGVGGG